jgi:hypothetical protein
MSSPGLYLKPKLSGSEFTFATITSTVNIYCNFIIITNTLYKANMPRRSQRSSLRTAVPSYESSYNNGSDESIHNRQIVVISDGRDVVVPPSPLSTSKPASSFEIKTDGELLIATQNSSNCTTSANIRRSERLKKMPVTKTFRLMKHTSRNRWTSDKKITETSQNFIAGNDQDITEEFSPLCVKKKMRRRALRSYEEVQHRTNYHSPNGKKLNEGKSTAIADSECEGKAESSMARANESPSKCIISSTRKAESATCSGGLEILEDLHRKKDCAIIGVQRMVRKDTLLNDENVSSVLFEESADFWDGFLLETYRQIASNNPDLPEFEPIPYPLLARGIPVDVESFQASTEKGVQVGAMNDSNKEYVAATNKPTLNESSSTALQDQVAKADSQALDVSNGRTSIAVEANTSDIKVIDGLDNGVDTSFSNESKNLVGPDSWQMDVIYRINFYLDQDKHCPYSMYSKTAQSVTEKCTKLHFAGNIKFRHLPGAIFEQIVSDIGGSTFLSIYMAAKNLSYGRLRSAHGTQVDIRDSNTSPNLIQLAVGYGFHMAQSITLGGQNSSLDLNESKSLKKSVEQGARTVLEMSKQTQVQFWNENILQNVDQSKKELTSDI